MKDSEEIKKALEWLALFQITGHKPGPIPKLIQDALDEYKRQHPSESGVRK